MTMAAVLRETFSFNHPRHSALMSGLLREQDDLTNALHTLEKRANGGIDSATNGIVEHLRASQ